MFQQNESVARPKRSGWPLAEWCYSAGVSRSMYYALEHEKRPASVLIGVKRLVVEPPEAWLTRVGDSGKGCAASLAG